MKEENAAGSDPKAAPRLIVPMSLQLVIPWRVALQQSSPPLHQPSVILKEKRTFEKEKPLNGKCANSKLSQQRVHPTSLCTFVPCLLQNWLGCLLFERADCGLFGLRADSAVVFEHLAADVPRKRSDRLLTDCGALGESRDERMPEIVPAMPHARGLTRVEPRLAPRDCLTAHIQVVHRWLPFVACQSRLVERKDIALRIGLREM